MAHCKPCTIMLSLITFIPYSSAAIMVWYHFFVIAVAVVSFCALTAVSFVCVSCVSCVSGEVKSTRTSTGNKNYEDVSPFGGLDITVCLLGHGRCPLFLTSNILQGDRNYPRLGG